MVEQLPRLLPASEFSLETLTQVYNQARVDYLVPMPMDVQRLAAYIRLYDVALNQSWVAVDGQEILGLAMLGVRPGRTWVTRLGVLPHQRRGGTGAALVQALLDSTRRLGCALSILEVIEGNLPAHGLFLKLGFRDIRNLLVLRRPAGTVGFSAPGQARWLSETEALDCLAQVPERLPWTNEIESYRNGAGIQGIQVDLDPDGQGWLVFREQAQFLSHFLFSSTGNSLLVARALLAHLYQRYPQMDTYIENIVVGDPHVPALMQAGCVEVFRRIEMVCDL